MIYLLTCSADGIGVDYEERLHAATAPSYWDCEEIAEAHGCAFWALEEEVQQC